MKTKTSLFERIDRWVKEFYDENNYLVINSEKNNNKIYKIHDEFPDIEMKQTLDSEGNIDYKAICNDEHKYIDIMVLHNSFKKLDKQEGWDCCVAPLWNDNFIYTLLFKSKKQESCTI